MAAVLDEYMDAPLDTDDVFPCTGCGEVRQRTICNLPTVTTTIC